MKLELTNLNGLKFWYRKGDGYVGQRVSQGKYEEYETKLMLSSVNKNSVAVDVGANIGYYTLLLAQKCKWVYAIEPDQTCFEILNKNVNDNNLKNVTLVNEAASDRSERRWLRKSKSNFGDHRLTNKDCHDLRSRNDEMVNCRRLDDILKNEQNIYLIKIDVQGWDGAVIKGAKNVIKRDRPIMFIEYSPDGDKDNLMINFLKKIYKNIWSIDYWFYICRRGISIDAKTGYVDLWLKDKMTLGDWWWTIKEVRIKKVIKAIMGYV